MEHLTEIKKLEHQLAAAVPVLDVVGVQLRQTASQIETAVVDVCSRFQSMMQRAQSGVTSASELLSGDEDVSRESIACLIQEAQQTIATLLQHTQRSADVSQSAIDRIDRVRSAADEIGKSLAQLDEITIGNRLLAVNARIQAVYAGDRAAGFGGVANEIAVQARRSSEIVDLIRVVSDDLRSMAQAASSDLQVMAASDKKAFEKSKLNVDRVLGDFQKMHAQTRDFIQRMTEENALVVEEISAAVRALQFQDRVNQRMDHVISELQTLSAAFSRHAKSVDIDSQAILQRLSGNYTMHEERAVVGDTENSRLSGDVELF